MAKCVFCGEKADHGKTIAVGDIGLSCCGSCYERYFDKDKEDIAAAVIKAGIFGRPWLLEEFLEGEARKRAEKFEKQAKIAADYKKWREGREAGICPKCGGAMIKNDPEDLVSYGHAFTIQMSSLNTDLFRVTPVICEDCGYTEFYSVRRRPKDPVPPERPVEE